MGVQRGPEGSHPMQKFLLHWAVALDPPRFFRNYEPLPHQPLPALALRAVRAVLPTWWHTYILGNAVSRPVKGWARCLTAALHRVGGRPRNPTGSVGILEIHLSM